MRLLLYLTFLSVSIHGYGQDTLYYDTLVKSSAGDFVKVKVKSDLTGLVDSYSLQTGKWHFYGRDGGLLKESEFKANAKDRASVLHGTVTYYNNEQAKIMS